MVVKNQIRWILSYILRDAKRHKIRNVIAILSIMISIGMVVGLNTTVDTLSNSYVDIVIENSQDYDLEITSSLNDAILHYPSLVTNITTQIDELDTLVPRMEVSASMLFSFQGQEISIPATIVGLNLSLENKLGIGSLEPNIEEIGTNRCLLVGDFGRNIQNNLNSSGKTSLDLSFVYNKTLYRPSLNVSNVVDDNQRLPSGFNLIIVDINQFSRWFGNNTKLCTNLIGKFNEPIYSALDPKGSVRDARAIALEIQDIIGLKYEISMPKAQAINSTDFTAIRLLLNFIALIIMGIATILIYSLNTIAIEEKTREFAMLRTLGIPSHKLLIILILNQLFAVIIGTLLGFIFGYLLTELISRTLLSALSVQQITITTSTMLFALGVGVGSGLISAIRPSLSLLKRNVVTSLEFGRDKPSEYSIKRERSVSKTMTLIGLSLSLSGSIVFLIFPLLNIVDDSTISTAFYLLLLVIFLLGMVLIALGLISPVLEHISASFLKIFKKTRKIGILSLTFLKKNRRRNSLTATIFAVSMAFILFISMTSNLQTFRTTETLRHHYGADLVVQSTGFGTNYLNTSVEEFARKIRDPVISSLPLIKEAASVTTGNIFRLTGCRPVLGDLALFERTYLSGIYGIGSRNFSQALYKPPAVNQGNNIWEKLTENQTVILSQAIASKLDVRLNDSLRLDLNSDIPITNLHYGKSLKFKIIGIVNRVPGFTDVHISSKLASSSAIFVGFETWNSIVHDNLANETNQILASQSISRVFLDSVSNDPITTNAIQLELFLQYGTTIFPIQVQRIIDLLKKQQQETNELLATILSLSLVIAFFAVFSSTQTGIMEMMQEIGIISAMGLKNRTIILVFVVEAVLLTIISTVLGGLIGYALAYLSFIQDAIATEFPIVLLPIDPIIPLIYVISVILAILGTLIPVRIIYKKMPAEIIRDQ